MVHGLGRWLRAAGYDTVIAKGGIPDRELARRYAGEDLILLTRDRHLAATAAGIVPVALFEGKSIDEPARALRTALDIDWEHAPFSRCIVDNRRLSRRRLIWRRRCRKDHAPPVPHCRCAPNAAPLLVGRPCPSNANNGLLRGNRKRPRPVNEPVWVRSDRRGGGSQRRKCVVAVSPRSGKASNSNAGSLSPGHDRRRRGYRTENGKLYGRPNDTPAVTV